MNWLDFVLLAIILVTTIMGLVKGLMKQVIGLAAVIAGLVLASLYYRSAAAIFRTFIHNDLVCHFLGFLVIFVGVLVIGAILGWLATKAMVGPLAAVNRLFGGVFGLVKSILICGILVFAMASFEIGKPAIRTSVLAPFCLGFTRAAVHLVPQDLRTKFDKSYKEIRKSGGEHGQKI